MDLNAVASAERDGLPDATETICDYCSHFLFQGFSEFESYHLVGFHTKAQPNQVPRRKGRPGSRYRISPALLEKGTAYLSDSL